MIEKEGSLPFLLSLLLTPVAAAIGTVVLMFFEFDGLTFHPLALLVGTVVGVAFAAPVTLLVLPLGYYLLLGSPYDKCVVHVGIGLISGAVLMLFMGRHTVFGFTAEAFQLSVAGGISGTICACIQWWAFKRRTGAEPVHVDSYRI
jgi:hypothetical protein